MNQEVNKPSLLLTNMEQEVNGAEVPPAGGAAGLQINTGGLVGPEGDFRNHRGGLRPGGASWVLTGHRFCC